MPEFKLFLLIVTANAAPLLAGAVFGKLYDCPIDRGYRLMDGQELFGCSKTTRGIISALVLTGLVGVLLGIPLPLSLSVALFAMLGDLFSSFIKRRLKLAPGSMALGLDQIPESLLPLLAIQDAADLKVQSIIWIVIGFMLFELLISRILYLLHIRRRPY